MALKSTIINKVVYLLIAAAVAIICVLFAANTRYRQRVQELEYLLRHSDTVYIQRTDTIQLVQPKEVVRYIASSPVYISDTVVLYDTVTKLYTLPREVVNYRDSNYYAVVSGVQPRLDSIAIFQKINTIEITKPSETKTKRKPKWGVGLQAGVGVNRDKQPSPYVGVGVQYNLLAW